MAKISVVHQTSKSGLGFSAIDFLARFCDRFGDRAIVVVAGKAGWFTGTSAGKVALLTQEKQACLGGCNTFDAKRRNIIYA